MQYKSRESALRALRKIVHDEYSFEKKPGAVLSEVEIALVTVMLRMSEARKTKGKSKWKDEREYRALKSIARGLGLFPIPEWAGNYVTVLNRLQQEVPYKTINLTFEQRDAKGNIIYRRHTESPLNFYFRAAVMKVPQ